MNILICGAGIAGLTAAHWLDEAGYNCTVIEKAPNIRTEGYMIDFGGSGWDVANKMGLIPSLEARQKNVHNINFMRHSGKIGATIDTRKLYKVADVDGKFMVINRRDVVLSLYEHIQDRIPVRFGCTVQAIQMQSEQTHVEFSDGTHGDYDLVIGADGIHSHIRQMVFGEEQHFTHYLGYHFAIFTIPAQSNIPYGFDMYLEPDIQVSVYPLDTDNWLIYIVMQNDTATVPTRTERWQNIKSRLEEMGWLCGRIAGAITEDTYIFYDTITQIINPNWSKERVVLIGDAAHCPTLVSGQGASMAMAGAYFLTQALQTNDNLEHALAAYETRLRPDLERIQKKARDFAPNFVPSATWKIRLIEGFIRFVDFPFFKQMIGKQFAVNSIIPDS